MDGQQGVGLGARKSFRWSVMNPGDTSVQPRGYLHAVSTIGDIDSISTSVWCWMSGTPRPLFHSVSDGGDAAAASDEIAASTDDEDWAAFHQLAVPKPKHARIQIADADEEE